jgi:hypothetical protein
LIGARPQVFALQYLPETTLLTQRLPLAAASRPKPRKRCNLGARFSPSWQQPRRARPATLRHWRPATLRHWRKVAGTRWPHARAGEAPANAQPGETQVPPPPRGGGRWRVGYRTRCAISYTLTLGASARTWVRPRKPSPLVTLSRRLRVRAGETFRGDTKNCRGRAAPRARGRDGQARQHRRHGTSVAPGAAPRQALALWPAGP